VVWWPTSKLIGETMLEMEKVTWND